MTTPKCYTITDKDNDVVLVETKNRHFIYPINNQDYYIATDTNPIIGSYGLDSSVCIIMRSSSKSTMLSNITDAEQIQDFFKIFDSQNKIDVYMMGGNSTSIDMCQSILSYFENKNKYNIKFVHLIDSNINSIGIDSRTGELYVNPDITYFV